MSPEILMLFVGPLSFVIGVICGVAIYRLLWHVDTAIIRGDFEREQSYNRALQAQIFDLQTEIEEMRGRMRTLEEVNLELVQERRARLRGGA